MRAYDVMVSPVITVRADALVKDVAKTLVKHQISAVPVLDDAGHIIGIVSEGDLMRRAEIDTDRRPSWWLLFLGGEALATEYVRARLRTVKEVMTKSVITARPDASLQDVATLLEANMIKRVPIVESGALVGIVSRANLIQALASSGNRIETAIPDSILRDNLLSHLNMQPWAQTIQLNVTVNVGVVSIWGIVRSEIEKKAIYAAVESIPGVRGIKDNVVVRPWHSELGQYV